MTTEKQFVAVDGMGGDFAPHAVIQGVLEAARQGVPVLLCGPEKKLVRYLTEQCEDWESLGIAIHHAPEAVGMAEEPVVAVRRKHESSLVQAIEMVRSGKACAAVSAGNSGALMAASFFMLGRQEGIDRPAIAGLLPTMKGSVIALDLGANVDCKPHYLEQFAYIGSAYAKKLLIFLHHVLRFFQMVLSVAREPSSLSRQVCCLKNHHLILLAM